MQSKYIETTVKVKKNDVRKGAKKKIKQTSHSNYGVKGTQPVYKRS